MPRKSHIYVLLKYDTTVHLLQWLSVLAVYVRSLVQVMFWAKFCFSSKSSPISGRRLKFN